MDLTLQSYLNEAVFSSGRGPEATFVSYLQTDHDSGSKNENAEDSSTSSQDRDHQGVLQSGKGSFISYIDDDESDSDDVSVCRGRCDSEVFVEKRPKKNADVMSSRSSTPPTSTASASMAASASWKRLNFRRLKSLRAKNMTTTSSCEEEFVASPTPTPTPMTPPSATNATKSESGTDLVTSPSMNRRKTSFRYRWRSRKNVLDDGVGVGGPVLRRSQSAKEVRGTGHHMTEQLKSPDILSRPDNAFQTKTGQKKEGSSSNLFQTFRLKRTKTLSSIVATWNKSMRINKRKSQSFRHLENFFTSFDSRPSHQAANSRLSSADISAPMSLTSRPSNPGKVRTRELSNIDPKFTSQSGLCSSSQLETSRGSIRIHHLTGSLGGGLAVQPSKDQPRFPRLEDCAHFHYEFTEIGPIAIEVLSDEDEVKPLLSYNDNGQREVFSVQVTSLNKTWIVKRSYKNFVFLDKQCHQCVFDRKISLLPELPSEESLGSANKESIRRLLSSYLERFSSLAGPVITCGPVLNWFELDNRGHRLIVSEDGAINRPAVAAAYAVKKYDKQAPDEISFEVGDMISVIDMPPPDESVWWRGKRGFEVGFFPCECVEVIGDKLPQNLNLPPSAASAGSNSASSTRKSVTPTSMPHQQSSDVDDDDNDGHSPNSEPTKPVLRKHGKLISFFRSFILSRPTRGKLKKSGILKERVFGCDLSEHLLNTGQDVPRVLTHCAEFIETAGMIDGIYRLSGIASNIQKLRVAFDEDRVPNLYQDKAVLQDVHSVSSLLKMYFRELPNPLCTYYLYDKFVEAARSLENERLILMREVVQLLPPPNYRTLEYLSRHLYRVSLRGHETGMTAKNVAIVWAPNLLRSKSLEGGGVAALQGVGVQAVVTECLIRYCELIFNDKMPTYNNGRASTSPPPAPPMIADLKKSRPKSLAISTPTKLLSLEEARNRALAQAAANLGNVSATNGTASQEPQRYIEVGGGPENLPQKYHTVIDIPNRKPGGSMKQRKSPIGWKAIFSGGKSKPKQIPKISSPAAVDILTVANNSKLMLGGDLKGTWNRQMLRPVKSAESLVMLQRRENAGLGSADEEHRKDEKKGGSASRPISGDSDDLAPLETVTQGVDNMSSRRRGNSQKGHERSNSHDSYFERKLSVQFNDDKSGSDPEKMDSSLDLSEIQVNFELEENEMKIFTEDLLSNSLGSDLSKSPLDEKQHQVQHLQQQQQQQQQQRLPKEVPKSPSAKKSPKVSTEAEVGDDSPKSRNKMSFREKFKRFTSPTPIRQRRDSDADGHSETETSCIGKSEPVKRTPSSIREKLVCALSPESLRRRHTHTSVDSHPTMSLAAPTMSTVDVSPKKKKSSFSPGTSPSTNLVKRSKIEDDSSGEEVVQAAADAQAPVAAVGLQASPSIKFMDSSMTESTDSRVGKLLRSAEGEQRQDSNPRFSTTSSTDDEVFHVDQLVVAQVHHHPIFESQLESETDDADSDLVAQTQTACHNATTTTATAQPTTAAAPTTTATTTTTTTPNQEALMMSFKREFAQKFSMTSQTSQTSGEKTPSEFSVSIAGATVSENESFSVLSVDDDQMMIGPMTTDSSFPGSKPSTQPSFNPTDEPTSHKLSRSYELEQQVNDQACLIPVDRSDETSDLLFVQDEVEAMDVDDMKADADVTFSAQQPNVYFDNDVERMDIDDNNAAVKSTTGTTSQVNRFEYRQLFAKETSNSSSSSSSSRTSVSEDSDAAAVAVVPKASSTSSVSTSASDRSSDRFIDDKSDENPLLPTADDERQETTCLVSTADFYPKQTSRFTLHVGGDVQDKNLHPVEEDKPSQSQPSCQSQPEEPSQERSPKSSAAKPDFTLRTFGPQPYTRKDISAPAQPIVQFDMEPEDCVVDLKRSYGGFRNTSGRFTLPNSDQVKSKFESSKVEAMDDHDHDHDHDGEARSISLPYVQTETEVDGRKSSQGIPEVEKKLSFAEPSLTKVPSDGTIVKGNKKLSTFSLHSAGAIEATISSPTEELPLQRRNSIHNVPYVDVNDPATRERMERYKEERRSMLRAKYRVEDYREKPPVSPAVKTAIEARRSIDESSSLSTTSPSSAGPKKSVDSSSEKKSSTTPTPTPATRSSIAGKNEKPAEVTTTTTEMTSPNPTRFRKSSSSSTTEKYSEKSSKVESQQSTEKSESANLRKLPIEKPVSGNKTNTSYLVENFSKQVVENNAETPARKWTSNSRTSLNSFDNNKKVSVSIIEPEVTLRKVATLKTDVIVPPTPQKPVPTVLPGQQEHNSNFPAKTPTRSSRASCPGGLVEDDVNVRERAAIFNTAAAHRANQAELRTKFVSLIPPNVDDGKGNNSRKNAGNSVGKIGGPGSPNKIKNIAAMFEQKT